MKALTPLPARSRPALARLFARYVAGQIEETTWKAMMHVLDDHDASAEERVALAFFLRDVIEEAGPEALRLPREGELEDLLKEMRRAA